MSSMHFDQILETPPSDVNRDALRQALQTEEARVRGELRTRRGALRFLGIFGTGMAIWAGLWIAITMTNGWSAIYAIGAGVSSGMFALGVGALWVSRGPAEPERNAGNTLHEDVRRSLALVDYQLSLIRHWISFWLGVASIAVATGPFSWTITRSQNIPDSSLLGVSGWWWYTGLLAAFFVRAACKWRNERREAKSRLEVRQRRLRELLPALDAGE